MVTSLGYDGLEVKDADGTVRRIEAQCKVWSAGVQASSLGKVLAEQTGSGSTGPAASGRSRPHRAGQPERLRRRRHDGRRQGPQGSAGARSRERPVRGRRDQKADCAGELPTSVLVLRQGLDGHDFAVCRGRTGPLPFTEKFETEGYFAWLGWLMLHLVVPGRVPQPPPPSSAGSSRSPPAGAAQLAVTEQQVYARTAMGALSELERRE